MLRFIIILFMSLTGAGAFAQSENETPAYEEPTFDSYQIYLQKPVQEIKEIRNFKDCEPLKGTISEGQKKIIMEDYVPGSKVYLQVRYTDGTEEEIIRSPCFIDPVIL
jgi:hypothetical protein